MDINKTKQKFTLKEQKNTQIMCACFAISITCMVIVLSAKILLAMSAKQSNIDNHQTYQQTHTLIQAK